MRVQRALSASGVPLPAAGRPPLVVSIGAGEEALPLRVFYFKYLMIGPGRAESIFSVYHVWRANHGFWRLGGAESPGRRPRGASWGTRFSTGVTTTLGCGLRYAPPPLVFKLVQTNPRQRAVGLMIKYLLFEITRCFLSRFHSACVTCCDNPIQAKTANTPTGAVSTWK